MSLVLRKRCEFHILVADTSLTAVGTLAHIHHYSKREDSQDPGSGIRERTYQGYSLEKR